MDVGVLVGTENAVSTIALSYRAAKPITDVHVICEGDTYRYEDGCLSSQRYGTQRFDEMRTFSKAVEQQDALFVDSIANGVPPSPGPQTLLPVYETLQRAMSDIEIRGEVEARG
jgi:hypothetical protein